MGFHNNFFTNLTTYTIKSWLRSKAEDGFSHAYYRTREEGQEVLLDLTKDISRDDVDIISKDLFDNIRYLIWAKDIDDAINSELESGKPSLKILVEERLWPLFEKTIRIKKVAT